ncbi:MAG: hypothetical protein E7551_07930 [Ruminococcaceae bacterium]|nr:hypothetical protein [Oscillospiraceae bacterium]
MKERILFIKLDPKTEADIICWMNSLPPRTVNRTVNEIVVAEIRGVIAWIPNEFSFTKQAEPLRCRLIFRSRAALNFLTKIPKGEYKSTLVSIIRCHIQKSKGMPPAPFKIHKRYLSEVTNQFVNMINAKKQETKGVPNRYDKLSKFYELAFTNFSNTVFECYKSVDILHGNFNLYHLNCADIINNAFVQVFGEIPNESVNENLVVASKENTPISTDENQEDSLYTILKYGLPDEILETIKEKIKESKKQ